MTSALGFYGTGEFILREDGILLNYFQGTVWNALLGSWDQGNTNLLSIIISSAMNGKFNKHANMGKNDKHFGGSREHRKSF